MVLCTKNYVRHSQCQIIWGTEEPYQALVLRHILVRLYGQRLEHSFSRSWAVDVHEAALARELDPVPLAVAEHRVTKLLLTQAVRIVALRSTDADGVLADDLPLLQLQHKLLPRVEQQPQEEAGLPVQVDPVPHLVAAEGLPDGLLSRRRRIQGAGAEHGDGLLGADPPSVLDHRSVRHRHLLLVLHPGRKGDRVAPCGALGDDLTPLGERIVLLRASMVV